MSIVTCVLGKWSVQRQQMECIALDAEQCPTGRDSKRDCPTLVIPWYVQEFYEQQGDNAREREVC